MAKQRIFISSVQVEFKAERQALHDYIHADPLLGRFFEPFLFELLPALDQRADAVYLREVDMSDIYLGLLGCEYGFEDKKGISPTEREFDRATTRHKTRLVFLTNHKSKDRYPKQNTFVQKAQEVLIRKRFNSVDELKSAVYAALVRYLEEKEIIRVGPFDASFNALAKPNDLDPEKVKQFVRSAKAKRGFPSSTGADISEILTHLNLINESRISNAALLLFGLEPQRFFINSEVRCASFHGTIVAKPIPSYKVFKGSVFELVDQAVDFVLSKLNYSIGTRKKDVQIPGEYEIPKEIVAEAIVNAIAHRDYTDNGSVQVMLFSDRLEIWNPGSLPLGWTTEKLKHMHTSVPANPLLAEPMYLAGYIERLGTGTTDIMRIAAETGLKEPQFIQDEIFRTILYRPQAIPQATPQVTPQATPQATPQVPPQAEYIRRVVLVISGEHTREEIQNALGLRDRKSFTENYLSPALNENYVKMTLPNVPTSPNQRYKLTTKGKAFKKKIEEKKN